jgi:hypothetical protein
MSWLKGLGKIQRHPELVSGSIYQPQPAVFVERWMLKQVQHDDVDYGSLELEITNRK